MRITKTSGEFEFLEHLKLKTANQHSAVESSDVTSLVSMTEEQLTNECEKIEVCASSDSQYFIPEGIDAESVSQLKEFASAIGLIKISSRKVEKPNLVSKISTIFSNKNEPMVKVASSTTATISDKTKEAKESKGLKIGDPFKFDEKLAAIDAKVVETWTGKNQPAKNLGIVPSFDTGIVPIRGGERTDINNAPRLAVNQNSIMSPDAIEKLHISSEISTGERLKAEKEQRKQARINNHKEWQDEKIKGMPLLDIVAKGVVFPTESLQANSGIGNGSSQFGVYSKLNQMDVLPEKTQGELIRESSQERKSSIQRDNKNFDWEDVNLGASRRSISEDFTSNLSKLLNKNKK